MFLRLALIEEGRERYIDMVAPSLDISEDDYIDSLRAAIRRLRGWAVADDPRCLSALERTLMRENGQKIPPLHYPPD